MDADSLGEYGVGGAIVTESPSSYRYASPNRGFCAGGRRVEVAAEVEVISGAVVGEGGWDGACCGGTLEVSGGTAVVLAVGERSMGAVVTAGRLTPVSTLGCASPPTWSEHAFSGRARTATATTSHVVLVIGYSRRQRPEASTFHITPRRTAVSLSSEHGKLRGRIVIPTPGEPQPTRPHTPGGGGDSSTNDSPGGWREDRYSSGRPGRIPLDASPRVLNSHTGDGTGSPGSGSSSRARIHFRTPCNCPMRSSTSASFLR